MPTFNCTFTARTSNNKRVMKKFSTRARNQSDALEKMRARILNYDSLFYPSFQFGPTQGLTMPGSVKQILVNEME